MLLQTLMITTALAAAPHDGLTTDATTADRVAYVQSLMPDLNRHASSRYIILSDSDRELITEAQNTLEETRRQYDRWCRAVDVKAPRPDQRLISIVFHDRDSFLEFAKQTEVDNAPTHHIEGYFSPRHEWLVLFNPADADDLSRADERLAEAWAEVDRAAEQGADPQAVAKARQQLADAGAELQEAERARRAAVIIHEAVHQLVHVSTAFPGRHRWPVWLHEAIAVSFETDNRRRPFGPDRTDARRRAAFETYLEAEELLPLTELVATETLQYDEGKRTNIIYCQSAALLSWMHLKRRAELSNLLQTVGTTGQDAQLISAPKRMAELLGPLDQFERRWLNDERR